MKFYRKIGATLKYKRLQAGESQTATGNFLGVSFQMIQKYEAGKCRIPLDYAWQLSKRWKFDLVAVLKSCE